MSGLVRRGEGVTYLNIKEGKLATKRNGVVEIYDGVEGTITKVDFVTDEYEGRKYEKLSLYIKNGEETYVLQMNVDSGYFRNFCNALKSGKPKETMYIQPSYKKDENGKTSAGCFISQGGKYLKHTHTKDNMGDLPPLEKTVFKGETKYDNSKQIAYWKNWLTSVFGEQVTEQQPSTEEDDSGLPF